MNRSIFQNSPAKIKRTALHYYDDAIALMSKKRYIDAELQFRICIDASKIIAPLKDGNLAITASLALGNMHLMLGDYSAARGCFEETINLANERFPMAPFDGVEPRISLAKCFHLESLNSVAEHTYAQVRIII